jgi:peptidoglycan/LPS O-acetylase OafA/YrhL
MHRHPSRFGVAVRRWQMGSTGPMLPETQPNQPGADDPMYRGSRLAASFLLVLTGLAASAMTLFVVPSAVDDGAARWAVPVAILFAIGHWAALAGVARGRDWGRNLAVLIGELGGGLAILGGVALLVGAGTSGSSVADGPGLVAWTAAVYTLLAIAAGRVPVLAHLSPLERRRVIHGPSFSGIATAG